MADYLSSSQWEISDFALVAEEVPEDPIVRSRDVDDSMAPLKHEYKCERMSGLLDNVSPSP